MLELPHPGRRLKVVLLSDVSVGYGTPQILRTAESFARALGAEVHVLEPDEPERPPVSIEDYIPALPVRLRRLYTAAHPYWAQGRIEYCRQAAAYVRDVDPDILLFSTMYGIEVLDHVRHPERLVTILYCLEDVNIYYEYLFPLAARCDIRIYPEENRRRIYSERLGMLEDSNALVLYNANHERPGVAADARQNRIVHAGTFAKSDTFAEYFLRDSTIELPIDIYGLVRGFEDDAAKERELGARRHGVVYRGYMPSDQRFFDRLSSYLYAVVMWNPDREDRFYAAPNKLFDAIACGVPPICAPHPQCVEIVNRWHCGLLMDDWTFESFRTTLTRALTAAGSDFYAELVENCRRAMREELSWGRQFDRLMPLVSRHLAEKTKAGRP